MAAASVQIDYYVAYRAATRLCQLRSKDGSSNRGGYCWQTIGAASPFGDHGDLVALQPGESRSLAIASTDPQVSLDVPDGEVGRVIAEARRPALIVAIATPVGAPVASNRYERACQTAEVGPSSPTGKGGALTTQHVVVGATGPIACDQLPPLSSE